MAFLLLQSIIQHKEEFASALAKAKLSNVGSLQHQYPGGDSLTHWGKCRVFKNFRGEIYE